MPNETCTLKISAGPDLVRSTAAAVQAALGSHLSAPELASLLNRNTKYSHMSGGQIANHK